MKPEVFDQIHAKLEVARANLRDVQYSLNDALAENPTNTELKESATLCVHAMSKLQDTRRCFALNKSQIVQAEQL